MIKHLWAKIVVHFLAAVFLLTTIGPLHENAMAQTFVALPSPGNMAPLTASFIPLQLKGIQVDTHDPFNIDFLVDKGNSGLNGAVLRDEVSRLSKYFLTCLTIPDKDLWVNLSPYEKDRIAPDALGVTQMGKDLLEEDYILKHLVATITYPETPLGKRFWKQVYDDALKTNGTTNVPVNIFQKVWIVPKNAEVYVRGNGAYVLNSTLDVMLESDYLAMQKNNSSADDTYQQKIFTNAYKSVILPQLRHEVNYGKNFAALRQIYSAMILAIWYKRNLHDGFLGRNYIGKNKVTGIDIPDRNAKEKIYQQYLQAFKKRAYDYVKEDVDPIDHRIIARKYVSGGFSFAMLADPQQTIYSETKGSVRPSFGPDLVMATIRMLPTDQRGIRLAMQSRVNTAAMGASVRKFTVKLAVPLMLAVMGIMSTGVVQAAQVERLPNGQIQVLVEKGDATFGHILQKIGAEYKKSDAKGYAQSNFSKPLWGAHGAVYALVNGQNVNHVTAGQKITLNQDLPQSVVNAFPHPVTAAISPVDVFRQPEGIAKTGDQLLETNMGRLGVKIEPPPLVEAAPVAAETLRGVSAEELLNKNMKALTGSELPPLSSEGLPASNSGTGAPKLSADELLKSNMEKLDHNLATVEALPALSKPNNAQPLRGRRIGGEETNLEGLRTLGLAFAALCFGILALKKVVVRFKPVKELMVKDFEAAKFRGVGEVEQEGDVITPEDLQRSKVAGETMKRLMEEGVHLRPKAALKLPDVATPGTLRNFFHRNTLRILDAVGFGVGVSTAHTLGLDGGSAFATGLFTMGMSRVVYLSQVWLHEHFHALSVGKFIVKPRQMGMGKSFARLLIPGTSWPKDFNPQVSTGESSRKNTISRWAGFGSTVFVSLGGLALLSMMHGTGMILGTVLFAPFIIGSILVLVGSLKEDILFPELSILKAVAACGVIGIEIFVPTEGLQKKAIDAWYNWLNRRIQFLEDRGGQEFGIVTMLQGPLGGMMFLVEKFLKEKRTPFNPRWEGGLPVFYRSMIDEAFNALYKQMPDYLKPVFNHGRASVIGFIAHVRFATQGILVKVAAHPHFTQLRKRTVWIMDTSKGLIERDVSKVSVIVHNGDNNANQVGISMRQQLFHQKLSYGQMRRFYPAVLHERYEGRVTIRYLKKIIDDGGNEADKGAMKTDYIALLKALRRSGYVDVKGFVSMTFKGLDDNFMAQFPDFSLRMGQVESALFDLPPGDSPLIARAMGLLRVQGDIQAAAVLAHVMVNHDDVSSVLEEILSEEDEVAVANSFNDVWIQVKDVLTAVPARKKDRTFPKSMQDFYVDDQYLHHLDAQIVKVSGEQRQQLVDQRVIIVAQLENLRYFRQMLFQRIMAEMASGSAAGKVFARWQEKYQQQGQDPQLMWERYLEYMVEKFLIADRKNALMEFAKRSDGTYGLVVKNSILSDGVTLYSNSQDLVLAFNEEERVFSYASDARPLKGANSKGRRMTKALNLKQGEVVDVYFKPNGQLRIRSYFLQDGIWVLTPHEQLMARIYSTEPVVNGKSNPYAAPDPVEYKSPRTMIQEDLENTSRILDEQRVIWEDPDSFNRQSSRHLAQRLNAMRKRTGKAELVIIGYDNSGTLPEFFSEAMKGLVPDLTVKVVQAVDFLDDPEKYVLADSVALVISKSGGTSAIKFTMQALSIMIGMENIFGMTARIDSPLVSELGQSLRSDSPFIKRLFLLGEFYPSEAPVVSDTLLEFHLGQLAYQLTHDLQAITGTQNPFKIKIDFARLKEMHKMFIRQVILMAEEATGVKANGTARESKWGEGLHKVGKYLGNVFLRVFWVNRMMDVMVYFAFVGLSLSHFFADNVTIFFFAILDTIAYRYGIPYLLGERYSKWINRPKNARMGQPMIAISGPEVFARSQRNVYSRFFANGLGSRSPRAVYDGDSTRYMLADHSSDAVRGDIFLNFSLTHHVGKGALTNNQITFPNTGAFLGTSFLKGRAEQININVDIPRGANDQENMIIENTTGFLGLLLASKAVGVPMAIKASFGGRFWNNAYSYSRAGVHTTATKEISQKIQDIIAMGREGWLKQQGALERQLHPDDINPMDWMVKQLTKRAPNAAMISKIPEGGINLDPKSLQWKEVVMPGRESLIIDKRTMDFHVILGMMPQVMGIKDVTPRMLEHMLGE